MKYLRVEITRTEGTELYLKVPDDFDLKLLRDYKVGKAIIDQAVKETITEFDWDRFDWEKTVEVESFSVITKEAAEEYGIFEVKVEKSIDKPSAP